ncbi:MAG: hypothetical protein NVV82_23715 [Sporocytophaga sp.]|nr:hypothetical protein [Sporocytophaga sp.]
MAILLIAVPFGPATGIASLPPNVAYVGYMQRSKTFDIPGKKAIPNEGATIAEVCMDDELLFIFDILKPPFNPKD